MSGFFLRGGGGGVFLMTSLIDSKWLYIDGTVDATTATTNLYIQKLSTVMLFSSQ